MITNSKKEEIKEAIQALDALLDSMHDEEARKLRIQLYKDLDNVESYRDSQPISLLQFKMIYSCR